MSDPPAFDDAQIVYLDEHYGGASSQNVHWMIFNGVLVFLMQCGFAMLCAGSVRAKNAQNILLKNLVDTCVGAMGFWATGYAFAYGDPSRRSRGNAFIGTKYFFLSGGVENTTGYENWFFQFAFAATAATIVSGAVAERCHLRAYAGYSAALTAFVYPVVAHWSWSRDGWLSNDLHDPLIGIGVVDFAGSGVVHMVGVPKPSDGPKEATSKFWGVCWNKHAGKWEAGYQDANGNKCYLGLFDDQELAALAVNAAIQALPPAVQRQRRANPVVDGKLVPKKRAPRKRRREEDAGVPCAICFDSTTVTLVCGHAMCEECMGRLAVFQGQTLTRSRRRVVIQCPLRCKALTERVLA